MDTDPRPDRGIPEDQAKITAHIGKLASIASSIDRLMSDVGALLTDPHNPDTARRDWNRKRTSDKIRQLRRLIPNWKEGQQLLEGSKKCLDYRNSFSHSSVEFRFDDSGKVIWEWISERKNGQIEEAPIDISSFETWEYRFHVAHYCFRYLIYPGFAFMRDLQSGPEILHLRAAVEEDEGSRPGIPGPLNNLDQAKEWLFPTA